MTLFPFIALGLLIYLCRRFTESWRSAAIAGSVVWGCVLVAITEGLNLFHAVTAGAVFACWLVVCVCLLVVSVARPRPVTWNCAREWSALQPSLKVLLLGVGAIVATCLVVALVAAPNTVDSMTYHLTRVEHWIQNQSVAHYPTHVLRELHRTPWAEFALLHLQLLSGGDRFANLVQWLTLIGTLLAVSLIVRELGADARGQILSVVVAGTIPMAILQASSTQTDLAGAYWMVCFVYFLLVLLRTPPIEQGGVGAILLAGSSLGLACLTKSTSYLHAVPFLVWFAVAYWRAHGVRVLAVVLTLGMAVGMLNAGYVGRNITLFMTPFGPGGSEECERCVLTNEGMSGPLFISNVLRNTAMHLRLPNKELNDAIGNFVNGAHGLMGIDPADPRTTWKQIPFSLFPPRFDENTDGNPLHLFLLFWTGLFVVLHRPQFSPRAKTYAVILLAAFLLLCLVVKWAFPNIRYQLGLFVLWAPVCGLALARLGRQGVAKAVAASLVVLAIPWLVLNAYRPLVGDRTIFDTPREAQFFLYPPTREFEEPFTGVSQFLRDSKCRSVGVVRGPDDWEYPLWVMLRRDNPNPLRIDEVQVTNVSMAASAPETAQRPEPCATVTIRGFAMMATVKTKPEEPGLTTKQPMSQNE